ncbi:hypothetical protein GCM10029964_061910 [Kibdelosporangium lantanae]
MWITTDEAGVDWDEYVVQMGRGMEEKRSLLWPGSEENPVAGVEGTPMAHGGR